ncbi:Nudix hydrolase 14, chloroplastic [Cyphellophora attinorum]|uniref:Nudix hydrolase 14, chloroplastic n=1 Tax=Cyphellophora attinorum TaxID=1664694 RepID=A0A0N0NJK6_9EURO|nr:Nudix hydrolase 14, chloroplastic [Phialophora attinorum]KPI37008.1 Nudix hydrolase 14, chloroplastic [Phialophora attinorum]
MSTGTFAWNFPNVEIKLPEGLPGKQLLDFRPFDQWWRTLSESLRGQDNPTHPFHASPYRLEAIEIQSVDHFGSRIGFIKLKATMRNGDGEIIPGAVFMRGGSVAMLIIVSEDASEADAESHVILTVQPRIPAGSLSFVELPAGMIDDSGTFSGAAAKEIKEETGLDIKEDELIDMTQLAIKQQSEEDKDGGCEVHLQEGSYPSPGGSDEFIPLFVVRKQMPKQEIEALRGKLTGLREHGEKITLKLVRLEDVWKVAARDGKTLAAIALYEALNREGLL